ncbi:DUF4351 domain-containing protein [Desulfatirhabdium butyrativorans]|uniref:DUF4351 domain-containing protein n=1 Tax=Desulfatirhabdium butyrativorans TaxID=340467 RepID=UPI00042A0883|nr:DUF4351 domain-containing protein [Desulfatirhabdium butyrativorans]
MISHDHHFKNLFLDFPEHALQWLQPEAMILYGKLEMITFIRQEPGKHRFSDRGLVLDMPILFSFQKGSLLLWIVEFQEERKSFSIYRLLRYATDMMEQFPDAVVIPTVLFTSRRRWHKDVVRHLESRFGNRLYLHFEYQLVRIIDYRARDHYDTTNPLLRILLPKMDYAKQERIEVICRAYKGLFDLADRRLFDKYVDFIDVYAEVTKEEQVVIYQELSNREETAMLAQYIRNKGYEEGIQQGVQQGVQQGLEQGLREGARQEKVAILKRLLQRKFGSLPAWVDERVQGASNDRLDAWTESVLEATSIGDLLSD